MLYHPAIGPGMTKIEAGRVLPEVAAEVQARAALNVTSGSGETNS